MSRPRWGFFLCLALGFQFLSVTAQNQTFDLEANQILTTPFPYNYPNENAAGNAIFPMPPCRGLVLEEATIDQLQDHMSRGLLNSQDILQCYLARYYQVNEYTRGVLQINPDAFAIAASLDAERAAGRVRGPLHGIPFLVKDNIATKDQMPTTAGSWALLGSVVPRDAHVVLKLRDAGALLMGHASLSEWADMRSNNYSEGFSARGDQARSAYNATANPGGSSSGSAISVSANQVSFALGTETDGSVINPAERAAVVGIKPTVGLTSRAGVVPESIHQDTVGTFGRTVKDATYVLDAIYGIDERDNYTFAQAGHTPTESYSQSLAGRASLQGARFGLPWASFWALNDPEQNAHLLELIALIESAGATIVNGTELPNYQTIVSPDGWDWDYGTTRGYPNESEYTVVKVDFYNNIRDYLADLENTQIRSLEDLVEFNLNNLGSEGGLPGIHPAFGSGQDGFLASLETGGVMDEVYFQALGFCQRSTREEGIDAALNYFGNGTMLDALLVPPDLGQTYQIAAQAGYPMVTLPAGVGGEQNMPFGLALMGTAWSEASLIRWASAIEDLQLSSETPWKRTLPTWGDYDQKVLPVL